MKSETTHNALNKKVKILDEDLLLWIEIEIPAGIKLNENDFILLKRNEEKIKYFVWKILNNKTAKLIFMGYE